ILQQTTHLTAAAATALRGAATFKARALKEAWNTTVVIPVDRGVKVNKNNGKSNGYREDLLPEENLLGMYNLHWKIVSAYIHGRIVNPFFTQRIKSNFVFAGPSKTAETLFKYIAPELVPVQYGGLIREGEQDFTASDSITEDIIKPATKHRIQFPVTEEWEARVVGYEITYGAEFVPSNKASQGRRKRLRRSFSETIKVKKILQKIQATMYLMVSMVFSEFGASTKAPGYNVFPDGTEVNSFR
ncbi:cellular retinaldehyde binding/alpha-tocopherol transport, partial [Tanacetum coccineum]